MVKRLTNASRRSNSTPLWYMPTNVSFLRTVKKRLSHSFHAFFWHTWPSCTFSFTKAPRCLKLLIPASNAIGRWGITVELSPEYPLNRNNWFVLHKLQHTKHLLLWSRHCCFVTSQTEREEGSGIAHAHKTWTPAVSFHVGNLLLRAFLKAIMEDWNCSNHFDTPCINSRAITDRALCKTDSSLVLGKHTTYSIGPWFTKHSQLQDTTDIRAKKKQISVRSCFLSSNVHMNCPPYGRLLYYSQLFNGIWCYSCVYSHPSPSVNFI